VVLDLTDPAHVHTLLDLEELLLEDWRKRMASARKAALKRFGRAVTDLAEGMLTPSRVRNGKNLVIYPRSLKPESKIEVLGQDKLPK